MVTQTVPSPPSSRDLLPPLLACLPIAFVSPRPPPALLPLLSPILRQRLQYAGDVQSTDGWLSLLSWEPQRAGKLASKVEGMRLEPHPVSGELEVEEVKSIEYRRLDEETLQARLQADEFDILPIYVWCETDTQGGEAGWKLAELRVLEDLDDGTQWYDSLAEAQDVAMSRPSDSRRLDGTSSSHLNSAQGVEEDDDDDDYWASYDRTPASRTPAKRSPAPPSTHVFSQSSGDPTAPRSAEEEDYYARYTTVQPALDDHDPDEAPAAAAARSTLQGNSLVSRAAAAAAPDRTTSVAEGGGGGDVDRPVQRALYPSDDAPKQPPTLRHPDSAVASLLPSNDLSPSTVTIAPRPISPASSSGSSRKSVQRLESRVRVEQDMTRAETGVKNFIGAEVRNLFRLARSVGMEADEFQDVVKRELEMVSMLEDS